MSRRYVLDASALLAFGLAEPGSEVVDAVRRSACINAVNLCEALTRLIELGGDPAGVRADFDALEIDVVPFDGAIAQRAAELRLPTRALGLSLGDRACLATAALLDMEVLTADRAWEQLQLDLRIRLIR